MSFSKQVVGSPKAVAAVLRAEGEKAATGSDEAKDAIRAVFEGAAKTAELCAATLWGTTPCAVVASVSGHVGTDQQNSLTISLTLQPLASEQPAT